MYDAMLAESVTITGHNGDEIEAYSARTLQAGPVGGVVVIHHLPGYDRQTKEFTRAFAVMAALATLACLTVAWDYIRGWRVARDLSHAAGSGT